MDNKLSVGAFYIHTSKWEKRGVRVVAFDGESVVIKRLGGGYFGVPAKSLSITTQAKARRIERELKMGVQRG